MRHPNQATLALHAGGDLARWRGWMTARHVGRCAACREEIAGYREMRETLPELAEMPAISWNRMAAEIQANVRLGLEAGECVRPAGPVREVARRTVWRPVATFASVALLVGGSLWLQRPAPVVQAAENQVKSSREGIQVQTGEEHMLALMNGGAQKVTYTMNAQGSVGARYTDPETGYVTINTVYAQ